MDHEFIRTPKELEQLCDRLRSVPIIGFDTEFVSEDTYRPDLCLIQVAADGVLACIDPKAVGDVTSFWRVLSEGEHVTLAHAAREELRFCLHAIGKRPNRLFDTQLAAGLIGLEYPSSYGKLISRLLNEVLPKGETRTDWRKRPLTPRQIEYALQDVIYLQPLYQKLTEKLEHHRRGDWLDQEMDRWQSMIEDSESRENWRRVSGSTGLPDKALVIVRELWRWREAEAQRRNRPARRVLRDDLIVELSRRGKSDPAQIRAIRGIERSVNRKHFDEIAAAIRRAQDLPKSEWPKRPPRKTTSHGSLVGQFISAALGSICRAQELAPSLVGTVQDVRDLVEYRLTAPDQRSDKAPNLATGWRAQIVGKQIDDLLQGRLAIRIDDPRSDDPLKLEPFDPDAS